jgi:hypothetical protein
MKLYYCIDWIAATMSIDKPGEIEMMEKIQKIFGDTEWWECGRTQRPYTNGVESSYASIYWHPERPEFKHMVRCTGEQLDSWRRDGGSDDELVAKLHVLGFRFTRLDLARDIFDVPARPAALYNAWRMGELQTSARKLTIIQSAGEGGAPAGETVYFGSRQSTRFLRVYDKAAQLETEQQWTRAEIELKSDNAGVAAYQVARVGVQRVFQTMLHSIILKGMPEWLRDTGDVELVALEAVPRKETDSERWLWQIVFPAAARALRAQVPGFRSALERALKETEL